MAKVKQKFVLSRGKESAFRPGFRSYFVDRDLGLREATGAGGQSRQVSTSLAVGRPQRRHQGGPRGSSSAVHRGQNGHGPRAQPAQDRGNRTSSARPITRPR